MSSIRFALGRTCTTWAFRALVGAVLLEAVGAGSASGSTFISQIRTILAEADAHSQQSEPDFDSQSESATHYGLFDSDVSAHAHSGVGEGSAMAFQRTTFTATTVIGDGMGTGTGGGNLMGGGSGLGESSIETAFMLGDDTPFTAVGSVMTDGDDGFAFGSFAEFRLTGPGGTVFSAVAGLECAPGCTVPFDESGVLGPGLYILSANAHADGGGGDGIGYQSGATSFEFEFTLDLPCPSDLDRNGAVDFGEILAVLGAWGIPGGPEDLDGSGVVDFGDILVVLAAWGECE